MIWVARLSNIEDLWLKRLISHQMSPTVAHDRSHVWKCRSLNTMPQLYSLASDCRSTWLLGRKPSPGSPPPAGHSSWDLLLLSKEDFQEESRHDCHSAGKPTIPVQTQEKSQMCGACGWDVFNPSIPLCLSHMHVRLLRVRFITTSLLVLLDLLLPTTPLDNQQL